MMIHRKIEDLLAEAEHCRRLAKGAVSYDTAKRLEALARDDEQRAAALKPRPRRAPPRKLAARQGAPVSV